MLIIHILLTILKILGILLLIAVGLVLLAVTALLFVPFTYTVKGDKNQESWGISARVSWLFGGISVRFLHRKETSWDLHILGIPVRKLMQWKNSGNRKKERGSGKKESRAQVKKEADRQADDSMVFRRDENPKQPADEEMSAWKKSSETGEVSENMVPEKKDTGSFFRRMAEVWIHLWQRLKAVLMWLVHLPGKIAGRIRKMWLTFRQFCDKIGRWKEFLTRDTTKAAVKFLLGRGRALLVHILPRKVRGHVTVGFEDPSLTGQLMAAAGVFLPLYRDNIQITPVFDRQVLEGDFLIKGRIFGAAFVWTAWKIFRNRDVRITWQGFRNKEA